MTLPPPGPPGTGSPPPGPPPYGPPPDRLIRGSRVALGGGLAILAHLLTIVAPVAIVTGGVTASRDATWLAVALAGQVLTFLGCMVFGILGIVRGDRGLGLGLLIGWAVGVVVVPVVGIGVCIAAFNGQFG